MKAMLLYLALFTAALLVIPMLGMGARMPAPIHAPMPAAVASLPPVEATQPASEPAEPLPEPTVLDPATANSDTPGFRVLDETTGEVREVPLRDFVRGAVAAEMPASFHEEALKAQAVAAHTFALHNQLVQRETPDPALMGADFTADPANLKVYVTEAIARDFYGEDADAYWSKITAAADAAADYVLEYDGEPIVAAYHAISGGVTEDAANIWTGSAPYLVPVPSGGDLLAPDYETAVTIPTEEFRARLTAAYPGISLPGDPDAWIGAATRSDSGYVQEIEIGDRTFHGKDLRLLLGLRSHNFEVLRTDNGFEFVVIGYGHGVGLSQYGADYMARQGADFREILAAYYTGAQLVKRGSYSRLS